jgi:hypothetical protein
MPATEFSRIISNIINNSFESYKNKMGLVNIELATPYLQEQVNRHGNVKIMCRVKMLGC